MFESLKKKLKLTSDKIEENVKEEAQEENNIEETPTETEKEEKPTKEQSGIFSFIKEKTITEKNLKDILWELELSLLESDVAMDVTEQMINDIQKEIVGTKIKRSNDINKYTQEAFKKSITKILDIPGKTMTQQIEEKKSTGTPLIVMFVGINGTGKTSTIAKIAKYYQDKGYTPVMAAGDTFRAGAIEQLTQHADNLGIKIIKHQKGSDPAAVAYDAVEHAKAQQKELVLVDTAGRMQTNSNLMEEMIKIRKVVKPDIIIFVGDSLTGNDAVQQAQKFNEDLQIDGIILTKTDADSKGGAALSIGHVVQKPILFLGMGQEYDDLIEFYPEWMIEQIFN